MRRISCRRALKELALYASGDLSDKQERRIEGHLKTCAACSRTVADHAASNRLMAEAFAPPEFEERFYAEIRSSVLGQIARDNRSTSWFKGWRWVHLAAAALILSLSGLIMLNSHRGAPVNSPELTSKAFAGPAQVDVEKKNRNVQRSPGFQLEKRTRVARRLIAPLHSVRERLEIAAAASLPGETPRVSQTEASRIEIQTANPNIRIIWLTPGNSDDEGNQTKVEPRDHQ